MKTRLRLNKIKYFLCVVLVVVIVGCNNETNLKNTIQWISDAEKPIKVTLHTINGLTMENRYTLIDAKGNVYNTGAVELTLPETIITH